VLSWLAEVSSVLLVEREVEHCHAIETQIVKAGNLRANLGLIAGVLMVLGVSFASLMAISQGKQIGGNVDIDVIAPPDRHRLWIHLSRLMKMLDSLHFEASNFC
jgi:hypothetical protein